MANKVSIIYSYRNRDVLRVKNSLDSLAQQSIIDFEVIFIDYGSHDAYAKSIEELLGKYEFAKYYFISVFGQFWSRSKALNAGIKRATGELIFVVDIDLVFAKDAVQSAVSSYHPGTFCTFDWVFMNEDQSKSFLANPNSYRPQSPKISDDNGMIVVDKTSLCSIHGYDEFFHLYGGEDTDLKIRLTNLGLKRQFVELQMKFFHIWHPHVILKRPHRLIDEPYVFNIKRINEKHSFHNAELKLTKPLNQTSWGEFDDFSFQHIDQENFLKFDIPNRHSLVSHFFNFRIHRLENKTVLVRFFQDSSYRTIKSRVKSLVKGNSEPYMTMQEINEFVSEKLVFFFRNHKYQYDIDSAKMEITLLIKV